MHRLINSSMAAALITLALAACGGDAELTCSPDATPVTVDGTATCECNAGFAGDGTICAAVAVTLTGARWELPCLSDVSSTVCNTIPGGSPFTLTETLGGTAGQAFDVSLRFRGVVETKGYSGGTADATSSWYAGGTPSGSNWNVYSLSISSPAATYYLNAGPDDAFFCIPLDFEKTVRMDAGATVTLYATSTEGQEIKNVGADATPIIVPGVAPSPASYDGQFVQVDVVHVTLVP
jgi:predicted small lipoprotein YifL